MRKQHHWLLWPGLLAVAPLTIAFVYLAKAQQWPVIGKAYNEVYAVYILGLTFTVLIVRSAWQHSLLYLLLGGFALSAWLREIHFEWIHNGVYVLLLVLIGLAWWWREHLKPLAKTGSFLPWFKGTMVVYLVGVLISKRAFRDVLPNEQPMHVALEEVTENVAHSMLLVTAIIGTWSRPARRAAAPASSL